MSHSTRDYLAKRIDGFVHTVLMNTPSIADHDASVHTIKRFFGIEAVDARELWSKKCDHMLVSIPDDISRRDVLFPNAAEVSFRLLYIRAIKNVLDTKRIRSVKLKDWYNAIQKLKSRLDKRSRSSILTPAEERFRKILKFMLHQTYYTLHLSGLIQMHEVMMVRKEVATILQDTIGQNIDDWLVLAVLPDGIIFSRKPIREKVEGDVGHRIKYGTAKMKLPHDEMYPADVTSYQNAHVTSNRRFMLFNESETCGYCHNKCSHVSLSSHYLDELEKVILEAKKEYNV